MDTQKVIRMSTNVPKVSFGVNLSNLKVSRYLWLIDGFRATRELD